MIFFTGSSGISSPRSISKKISTPTIQKDTISRVSFSNTSRIITNRNIFGSPEYISEEIENYEIEGLDPTSLKIILLGTVTGNQKNAFAVIEDPEKKKQRLYRIGDSIQKAVLKKILRGQVVLNVKGKDEILKMKELDSSQTDKSNKKSTHAEEVTERTIKHSYVQKALNNINDLISQARIRPHFIDGKPDGLKITQIRSGSIFSRLGLKNRDIVKEINGSSITNTDEIISLYKDLKPGGHVALDISRKGEPKTLKYIFK